MRDKIISSDKIKPLLGHRLISNHFLLMHRSQRHRKYISIMQQITRGAIPRKRFGDLPRPPFASGMRCYVEVNCAPPMVAQHYEDKQQAKAHRRHHEKIC